MTSAADYLGLQSVLSVGDEAPSAPAVNDLWYDTTLPGWKMWDGSQWLASSAIAAAVWGAISGTLSDQTDLQSALDLKANNADLVWGGITGTLSNQTDLQTALDLKENSADLGAAAALDVGVAIGDVVQVADIGGAVAGLPALNGSLLTDLPVQFSTSANYTIIGDWAFSTVLDLSGYVEAGAVDGIQSGGTLTFTLEGAVHEQTLTGNVTTWTLTLPTAPKCGSAVVILKQAATAYTVAYPGTWKWANGTAVDIGPVDGDILELVLHSTPSGDIFVTGQSFAAAS